MVFVDPSNNDKVFKCAIKIWVKELEVSESELPHFNGLWTFKEQVI